MKLSNYQQINKKVVKNYKKPQKNHKTTKKTDQKSVKKEGLTFWGVLKSKRMVQVYGILFMAFAVLLCVALVSSFYYESFNKQGIEKFENTVGIVGAILANTFISNTFGYFSLGFVLLFFIYGYKLTFERAILPAFLTTVATLATMAWLSTVFGCFFRESSFDFVSGAFGNQISKYLIENTQTWGTGLILFAAFFIILVLFYNISPRKMIDAVSGIRFGGSSEEKEERRKEKEERRREKEERRREKEERKKEKEKGRKEKGNKKLVDEEKQKLPGLYAEDRNELRNEYEPKEFIFKGDRTVVVNEEPGSENKVDFKIISMPGEPFDDEMPDEEEELETDNDEIMKPFDDEFMSEEPLEDYDPRLDLSMYKFPELDLLNDYEVKEMDRDAIMAELQENVDKIEITLKHFGILIKDIRVTRGPTVTLYEIVPADGIRISKIKNLEDDIALNLAALGIRIIAPIPGKGTIGIEVPNKNAQIVSMKEIIASEKFQNNKYDLPIGLGKTISNEPFVVDLAKMPHLLMAGATGQGKSVGLNAIIASLLYKKHPAEMKLVLVDPKVVEFSLYSIIEKHYLAKLPDAEEAIITDTKKVIQTLNSLCIEMDARYDLLKLAKTRNIKEYNHKFCTRKFLPPTHRYLPYIVLIIDEFGDLIMTAGREVEMPIARLAQKARAVGIHLIFATQRPSVNIITGTIKANFPARLAFKVASKIDSKIILDGSGAEQLIGKGDMLFSTGNDIIRIQCAFMDTPEVEKIAQFIEEQQSYPEAHLLPEYIMEEKGRGSSGEDDGIAPGEIDPMFTEAATLIVQTQMGSTSLIQRKMKLGYNRAGRVMDQLEEFGIVGPSMGSKAREVKVKTNEELMQIFQRMGVF